MWKIDDRVKKLDKHERDFSEYGRKKEYHYQIDVLIEYANRKKIVLWGILIILLIIIWAHSGWNSLIINLKKIMSHLWLTLNTSTVK